MQKAVDKYYKQQARKKRPLTIQGLALALDFNSRQSLLDYEGYTDENDKGFLDTIKKARLFIENDKVENMLAGEYSTAGVIFDLKNNHGHKDKSTVDMNLDQKDISDEELTERIKQLEQRLNK
jgi:hypothetical protein